MADLISRQDAIEWCLEGLNNLPSTEPEPHWIPCSEGLPEISETYIVTGRQRYTQVEEWDYFIDCAIFDPYEGYIDNHWTTWTDWIEGQETHIIAWMPLPSPYQTEEESE